MARKFIWAVDELGRPCKCFAQPENRGKRNCNHIAHAEKGQSREEFFKSAALQSRKIQKIVNDNVNENESISQREINSMAKKLDEICGEKVTEDNYEEILSKLTPEQLTKLTNLGFEAAPAFSMPITDEKYDEENISNKIYFTELPSYGIGGKENAIEEMFGAIGVVPTGNGDKEVKTNYRDGLSAKEYFTKQFSTRGSQVQKTVAVSKPGACARITWYGLSNIEVIKDCGNNNSKGIKDCLAPGVCKKCARKSGQKLQLGSLPGGTVSTNLTEGLTQASLNAIHTGDGKKQDWELVSDTLLGYSSSPIIKKAQGCATTEETRETLFNGLREVYDNAGIQIDDWNLEVAAKQLTSYKYDEETGQLRYVREGELCSLPGMRAIGNHNNLFLQAELRNSYSKITTPQVIDNSEKNAVTEAMR